MARHTKESAALAEFASKLGVSPEDVAELADLGFEWADQKETPRLIVASAAKEKCGKTHFSCFTTPEPVALIDFDLGTEGVLSKRKDRAIIHKNFSLRRAKELANEKPTQAELTQEWENCRKTMLAVIRSNVIRTLVVDTLTEMWELARLAEFGKLEQVKPHHYAPVNREFRSLIEAIYSNPKLNAVLIHKVKKEYVNDKSTGKYERSGFSDIPFIVQANIEHYKRYEFDDNEERQTIFGIRVINSRHNPELDGEELEGDFCSFTRLGMMAIPTSKGSDWR